MKIIILTGSELRHDFVRKKISTDNRIDVLKTYCEGNEKSLESLVKSKKNPSQIELLHVEARKQAEKDFFAEVLENIKDYSNPVFIKKGTINDDIIVNEIISLKPDLLVCYGSSVIKSKLVDYFKGRFLNVHLGLSPYYRGSGTNVWPLINKEPGFVGATFMYLDEGIDTGEIIHQLQAKIFLGDSVHSIGNRLIKDMTYEYIRIIVNFRTLTRENQFIVSNSNFYKRKDFDKKACEKLYQNFSDNLILKHLEIKGNLGIKTIQNRGMIK